VRTREGGHEAGFVVQIGGYDFGAFCCECFGVVAVRVAGYAADAVAGWVGEEGVDDGASLCACGANDDDELRHDVVVIK
jgi:hypothetical protein